MEPNSDSIRLVPMSGLNVIQTYKVAKSIFPRYAAGVRRGFIASMIPTALLPAVSNALAAIKLKSLDYFAGVDNETGKVVGVTGLYAVEGKNEAWIGWYGVSSSMRGQGAGKQILDWTINAAKGRGFDTLRLWTSNDPEYKRANAMYNARGFVRQDLDVADPMHPENRQMLYGLGLHGQSPEPFKGDLREALLGVTLEDIQKGQRAFQLHRANFG